MNTRTTCFLSLIFSSFFFIAHAGVQVNSDFASEKGFCFINCMLQGLNTQKMFLQDIINRYPSKKENIEAYLLKKTKEISLSSAGESEFLKKIRETYTESMINSFLDK